MKLKHILKNYHVPFMFKLILISICVFVSIVAFQKTYHTNIEGYYYKSKKKRLKENRKKLENSKKNFENNYSNFLSSETRSSCDLMYGNNPYGLFSFVKKDSTYIDNSQNHFVEDCGFYGCDVGVVNIKTNDIRFGKGKDIRTKNWNYVGSEQFYFMCDDSQGISCSDTVKIGDTVKLYSTKKNDIDNSNNTKTYKISDVDGNTNNVVKYNSDITLTLQEDNTPVEIRILATPDSKAEVTCDYPLVGAKDTS